MRLTESFSTRLRARVYRDRNSSRSTGANIAMADVPPPCSSNGSLLLVTTLPRNNVTKDGDMLVYSAQGSHETPLPGAIAIEIGKTGDLSKAGRDTTLWLDHSDCQVFPFESTP